MSKKTNYWTWTDSELQAELEVYKVKLEGEYTRKAAVAALKLAEVKGEVKETRDFISDLKKEQPTLELRKVIFHSVGEQDIPYVFVGHNGRAYYIPKEVEVEVPVYILNSCIKDAVEERLIPQQNNQGDINWVIRKVQRYPYSYVD